MIPSELVLKTKSTYIFPFPLYKNVLKSPVESLCLILDKVCDSYVQAA